MSVTDDAILEFKRLIISGRIGPGEKLPRESELAAQLGLSRTSLRGAVRALALIGVLNTRQGDGTYVTGLGPQLLLEATSFVADFLQDQQALLEVRRLLEPTATALAAVRISELELSRLPECRRRMDSASTVAELVEADDGFHDDMVDATRQATLASLITGDRPGDRHTGGHPHPLPRAPLSRSTAYSPECVAGRILGSTGLEQGQR